MAKRRRWEEELQEELEHERSRPPRLADLDDGKRAGVLEELQRAGGNRAVQQVVSAAQLQREAAVARPHVVEPLHMKIDGIRGPMTRKGYEGAFELEQDYELEVRTPTDKQTGMATGKRQYSDLKVVVRKSVGVTELRRAITTNKVLPKIVLVSPLEDGTETVTLKNALVVGVRDVGTGNVEIRFSFEEVTWDAGSLTAVDQPRGGA